MSETVYYTGRLQLVEKRPDETLEEQCKRILSEHHYDNNDYYDSWAEMLCDEFYKTYVIVDENIYRVIERTEIRTDEDVFNAHDNKDGTIDFEVMYYNGGCGFDEAIAFAIDNMKKKS